MAVHFRCSSCTQKLHIGDEYIGSLVACPTCRTKLRVPQESEPESELIDDAGLPAPKDDELEAGLLPESEKIDFEELIDMTAMVDIVFFLLIFFLTTAMQTMHSALPMPQPNPQAGGSAAEPTDIESMEGDDDYIKVTIDKTNAIQVAGDYVQGPDELLLKIRALRDEPPHPKKMLVQGHGDATHGTMVMVLDAGYDAGIESIKMAVSDQEE